MHFTKMHGAGNDFIIIEDMDRKLSMERLADIAVRLCSRRFGIGADGLMVVVPAGKDGDYGMLFFNSDGSIGEMCGNGSRCIARYGYIRGLAGEIQRIETVSGTVVGERISETEYRVRLNDPSVLDWREAADGTMCSYVELGVPGLPHAAANCPGMDLTAREHLFELGCRLRYDPAFPKGANVTLWDRVGTNELKAVTYERGVEDFTLACGTGAASLAAALTAKGVISGRNVTVHMPGGTLEISLTVESGRVYDIYLTGPTCVIAEGEAGEELLR